MADEDSWDAESFEPDQPIKKAPAGNDRWEGEDEEEDVKDNWDEEEEEEQDGEKAAERTTEVKPSEKKKLSEKIKLKEDLQRQKEEELQKMCRAEETEVSPERRSSDTQQVQEESDLESASDTSGVTSNHVTGIDGVTPFSKDDFNTFEKMLKEKITPYDKSVHYCSFLESLFRNLCTPLEVEELKSISNGLTVLLSEKQKQEKSKGKKKKKGVVPGGGLKAKMKDDLADYGHFDGGYTQDYEDFM